MANPLDYQTSRWLSSGEEATYSQHGKAIVNHLSILLKTARLHSPDNDSFKSQLEQCYQLCRVRLDKYGEVVIQIQSDYLFFCGIRLRYDNEGLSAPDHLRDLFQQIGISGLLLTTDLIKAELEQTILLLNKAYYSEEIDFEEIQRRFNQVNIGAIIPLPLMDEKTEDDNHEVEKRRFARRTFFYAMNNLKMISESMTAARSVDLSRTKRVIHSLVDQIVADDGSLLELTALKSHDQYTFLHSTNVCIYSICLGARLNFTKSELSALGFSALFHDIGKMLLPLQVLNKPSDFDESDWELMRKHPILGVVTMAKTMPFEERCCHAMIVAAEHHYNLDGSGYPILIHRRKPNLYSKIVTICDVFDAMTSGRIYHQVPASPDQVLRGMLPQAGYKFDPCLLKTFFNTVSLYPPGTLLLLDRQELALVVGKNADNLLRPKVKIVGTTQQHYDRGIRINLAECDPQTGKYYRSIIRVAKPSEYRINTTQYLLDEE